MSPSTVLAEAPALAFAPERRPRVLLALLGGFELQTDAQSVPLPKRAQRLLVFLALHPRPLAREYVAGSLWLDASEGHAHGNLRSALWRLGCVGPRIVTIGEGCLALGPAVGVDLHRSVRLAKRLLINATDVAEADLDESLLSEDLLPDWYEDWVLEERNASAPSPPRAGAVV
jgi:DNA-binding SARP family transcriptional activator